MNYWRLFTDKIGVSTLIPLVIFAIVILPVFGWLQVDWLSQLRERETEQMQRALETATQSLSKEIDHALQTSYTHFKMGTFQDHDQVQDLLSRRAREFRFNNAYGPLVDQIYWITANDTKGVQSYSLAGDQLQAAPLPESLAYLESIVKAQSQCQGEETFNGGLIQAGSAMVIPERSGSNHCGMTVLLLDHYFLENGFIAQLTQNRFEDKNSDGFALGIINNRDNRNLIFNSSETFTIDDYQQADYRQTAFGFGQGHVEPAWTLLLKHRSGSIQAVTRGYFYLRLTAAALMSLLILAGILFPYLKLLRAIRESRNQMTFFSGLSHDLRTPLTTITAACFSLDRPTVDPEKAQHYGKIIGKEAQRLNDMITGVLEYSRSQASEQSYAMEDIDLRDLVDEVVEENEALLGSHDIALDMNLSREVPFISGDVQAIKSALTNLINNAVKYAAKGQWLGLHLAVVDSKVRLSVADQGEGIAASDLSRLFKPYYRAKSVRNTGIQGNGLGLSMVDRIMQLHGGQVTVETIQGQGSTFSLEFPIDLKNNAGGLQLWKRKFSL